jgi:hypothetical protein
MLRALERGDRLVPCCRRGPPRPGNPHRGAETRQQDLDAARALSTGEAQYLSNDRVLVDLSESPPMAYGLPTIAKVRADSLDYLPRLTPSPNGRHYETTREYDEGSSLVEPTRRADRSMSPAQLCRWLDVSSMAAAPIGLIVFVRVDPSVERLEQQDLAAQSRA